MIIVQRGLLLAMFPSVTHVVLGERNKNIEKKNREEGGVKKKERGDVRIQKNNNRLWKGDKLRNKECMHEREEGESQRGRKETD